MLDRPKRKRPRIPRPVPPFRARKIAVQLEVAMKEGNKPRFIQLCKRAIRAFHLSPKSWQAEPEKAVDVYLSSIDPRIGGMLQRRARVQTVADLATHKRHDIRSIKGFGKIYLDWCDEQLKKHGLDWAK